MNRLSALKPAIQHLRRNSDHAYFAHSFRPLIEAEPMHVARSLSLRWLISVLDTYADYGDQAEALGALLGVLIGNGEKLRQTERRVYHPSVEAPAQRVGPEPLFEDLTCFVSDRQADMHRHLARRLRSALRHREHLRIIIDEMIRRLGRREDTLLGRLDAAHDRDLTTELRLGRDYKALYDRLFAAGYNRAYEETQGSHGAAWLFPEMAHLAVESLTVLDVGCGRGGGLYWWRDRGRMASGCDVSDVPSSVPGCQIDQLDARDLFSYADGEFALVVCCDTLEHLEEQDAIGAIYELIRVAGEYVGITVSNQPAERWAGVAGHDLHLTRRPADWWRDQLTKAGATVIRESGLQFIAEV